MSALSDLVYGKGKGPWPYFTDKYPVKVKQIIQEKFKIMILHKII